MTGVILLDLVCTFAGQPASYWRDPTTGIEGNRLVKRIVVEGHLPFLLASILYVSAVTWLVSITPRKLALMGILGMIFGHYFGASTWLCYRFGIGVQGPILYGILLGILLVSTGSNSPEINSADHHRKIDPPMPPINTDS